MKLVRFVVLFVFTVALGGAALGGSLALLGPAGAEFKGVTAYSPIDPAEITPAQRSYMYDRNGTLMTALFAEEDRSPITLAEVPQHLIDAVIAIEDRKFYEHDGVDFNGIIRALFENLDAGEVEQGGSTITQQLVKVTMTPLEKRTDSGDRTLKTKFTEAVVANRLEDVLTKEEILERYLNVVYLGNSAYGVQAAAERYWNKQPKDLTIGEAALLAGLIQAPGNLDPITHPDRAARRRDIVLDAMVEMGTITEEEADAANLEPLPTQAASPLRTRDFFTTEVIEKLLNDDPNVEGDVAEYLGATQSARYNAVFRGGLRIHTTYDPLVQFIAASSVSQIKPENSPVVASVVVIDNADMAVRAMYPGFDFSNLQYNPITTRGRQTGSSFKVITLLTALDAGYSPKDRVSAGGLSLSRGPDQEPWTPSNCRGGTMTLRDALVNSQNCAFGRLISSLGPGHFGDDGAARVVDMAGRLGIDTSKLVPYPALTLGASDTNMLDMAEAFATIANDGVHRPPMFVTRIEGPDGEVIYEANQDGERVFSEQVARTASDIMQGVIERGTATRADIGRPAAGKTGTTNKNTDAWFVGFTPQMTAAVWMGHPDGAIDMKGFGISNAQGGNLPATIWHDVMQALHENLPVVEFTPPDEKQWATGQRITEEGRQFTREFIGDDTTTGSSVPGGDTSNPTVPSPETTVAPTATAPLATVPPVTPPAVPPPQSVP